MARAIAREQTLEVPEDVAPPEVEGRLLGRVESLEPAPSGRIDARISFDPEIAGASVPQLLNAVAGNVTLMPGVRLVDVRVPEALADDLGGPRHGIEGLRRLVAADEGRPLVSVALKPMGLSTAALSQIAETFVRAGVDVVKDDHGLWDQPTAPLRERIPRVAEAVRRTAEAVGGKAVYFPNITGPIDRVLEHAELAAEAGCGGIMVCPSVTGLDTMRWLAGPAGPGLPVMGHPSHANCGPGRDEGIAPEVLLGTLYRLAGADAVVYVNAHGRFSWPLGTCLAINERLRQPLGRCRPAMPTPAGGVQVSDAASWFERYGPDTMLLIGGSLLQHDDIEGATREVVAAAHAVHAGEARA